MASVDVAWSAALRKDCGDKLKDCGGDGRGRHSVWAALRDSGLLLLNGMVVIGGWRLIDCSARVTGME